MRDLIDPGDGENRAVRWFLACYGSACGVTVGAMKRHLKNCGYPFWPAWADEQDGEHLTKLGAQNWLRHLFALEAAAGVKGREPDAEFLRLLTLCETSYYTATRALDVPVVDVERCRADHARARGELAAYVFGVDSPDGGQKK